MFNSSLDKLCAGISAFAEGALIFSDVNILYFTGFSVTDACLAVHPGGAVLFTDSRYVEAAAEKLGADRVVDCRGEFYKNISSFFSSLGITKIAVESDRLTVAGLDTLRQKLPDAEFVTDSSLTDAVNGLRAVKNENQLEKIICAQRIAEKAFSYILGEIKPGVTERSLSLKLDYYMLGRGAEGLSFETICVAGAKSSMPHGVPGENVIKNGDFVTFDFGAVVDGWHSDMTRTVAVGFADDKMKNVYDTVLSAQKNALAFLAPGKNCSDADAAARDIIKNAGYGEFFGHSTGHGVGVEIHEFPNLSPRSRTVLAPGHVVTVEPGIYLPGEFGVRIEDMAFISGSGAVNLTNCPKELIIL